MFWIFTSQLLLINAKNVQFYISLNIVLWQGKLWAMKAENCENCQYFAGNHISKNHYWPIFCHFSSQLLLKNAIKSTILYFIKYFTVTEQISTIILLISAKMSISDLISWLVITFQKIINGLFFGFFNPNWFWKMQKNVQFYISLNIVLWQSKLWAMKAENCEKLPIIRWKSDFKKSLLAYFLPFFITIAFKKRKKLNNFIFH